MKENFIHVCFVIDRSGSMCGSENDVIGGFEKVIKEQKANNKGQCAVSLYEFDGHVEEVYRGKDVNDIHSIDYSVGGCTALFDGVGTAIDNIGKWLNDMDESERPEKNLIVVMTDGGENASYKYSSANVKAKIKEQEEKYNWSFIYMGSDLTDANDANALGFTIRVFNSKDSLSNNYETINCIVNDYRLSDDKLEIKHATLKNSLNEYASSETKKFASVNNIDVNSLLNSK